MFSAMFHVSVSMSGGARWPNGLEWWTGERVVMGSNPAAATSLRNFGNFFYPALPVSRARSHPVPGVVAYFRHGYATVQE